MKSQKQTHTYMKEINRIAFIFYVFLLVVFPFGVVLRFTPVPNVNIYPLDVAVGVIAVLTVITFIIKRKSAGYYNKLLKAILIFDILAILSLALNYYWLDGLEPLIATSYLIRLNAYLSLIFLGIFAFSNGQIKALNRVFVIGSLFVVFFGFIQYLFYNNLRNLYYLGWDEHLYRMFSTFLDPNFLGLFLAILIIFLLSKIIGKDQTKVESYITLFMILLSGLALVLTYSRTAIMALVAGTLVLAIYVKKVKLLIVVISMLLIGVFALSNFSIEGMNPLRIASTEARIESSRQAFEIFSDSPLWGIGFNAYRYAQTERGFRDEMQTQASNADAGTDNSLLFLLATTGILGAIAYINIWRNISLINTKKGRVLQAGFYSIIITLFVGSLFINAFFYMPIMVWVFSYVGIYILRKS